MMSIIDNTGVEKQIKHRDGVLRVDANFLSGTATIVYYETRVAPDDIKTFVAECGYHCRGEVVPSHVCESGRPTVERILEHLEQLKSVIRANADVIAFMEADFIGT